MKSNVSHFTTEQLACIDLARIPRHIAIIPDGNRRWAKMQMENPIAGHRSGANVLIETVKAARELGIKTITFYMFSTENWNRSREEVAALMWLLQEFLRENLQEMHNYGVRLHTIGDLSALPNDALEVVKETCAATACENGIDMVMALNYGSRDELRRAFQNILDSMEQEGKKNVKLTEEMIAQHLDTARWGDPELLIRTSGEMRISNFLLWQLSYSEIYITDTLWPDFSPNELIKGIAEFQKRQRRLGL